MASLKAIFKNYVPSGTALERNQLSNFSDMLQELYL